MWTWAKSLSARLPRFDFLTRSTEDFEDRHSRAFGKCVAEHRISAFGLLTCRLVLNDIPVLDQHAIFDANDVCRDPVHRRAKAGESTVNYHQITFSHDYSRLILQRVREALDEVEQAIATRCDMSAVRNVVR